MRLHTFRFSPNALKVRLALSELKLPHEAIEVDLFRGEHRTDVFAKLNPFQRIPVFEDGGLVLRESNAILAFLGETHGTAHGWPADPAGRAMALQWLFFEAGHMGHGSKTLWWNDVVAPRMQRPGADAVVVADAVRQLQPAIEGLEAHFQTHAFVLGEAHSLVDCALGVAVGLLRGTRVDRPDELPRLTAYRERIRQRPSWTECHGDALHTVG